MPAPRGNAHDRIPYDLDRAARYGTTDQRRARARKTLEYLIVVRSLAVIEIKVRAAFQRAKVRYLHDPHRFAVTPFDGELLRRLVVLKLWQVQNPFDPEASFEKIHGTNYDWEDLHRLVKADDRFGAKEILRTIEMRFASLSNLTASERALIGDSRSGRNKRLAEQMRAEIRTLAESS